MKILNISGTATASVENLNQVLALLEQQHQAGTAFCVTVAAFENVTNQLIHISTMAGNGNADYKESLNELKEQHLDRIRGIIPVKNQSRVLANTMMLFNDLEDVLHGVFLIRELTPKSRDLVLSFGERMAAYILSEAAQLRFPAQYVDARELIRTDNTFGRA
ncbi:bifunctional aspartate kinase/homoserine dehydrogenase I, partial [bacterium]|nr:bifunctional aspartate kinase/homoserine dehydrogenase I [bacterium]